MSEDNPAQWYRQVLDAISDFVVVKDTKSRLIWANQAFCDYYNMSREALTHLVDADTSDPDDTAGYLKDDYKVLSEGKSLHIPHEAITDGHGNVRYFQTIKEPIFDDQRSILGLVCVARMLGRELDIADFEKQREQWKAHLAELRTLVHAMPLAVAMFDAQMRFLAHSHAWHDLFAYSGTELIGRYYSDLFETCMPLHEHIHQVIGGSAPLSLESCALTRADGLQRIVNVEIRPWFAPAGDTGGTIVLIQDVTNLQQTNQKLRQLNDELLQFNYRVSHDLLAPLRTVQGYLDLCEADLDDGNLDEVRCYHGKIRQNVMQLAGLVEDVLDLARSDVLNVEKVDVDLDALLHSIREKHQESIASASIELSVQCDVEAIRTERIRIQQILENLIANAIKYHDLAKEQRLIDVRVTQDAGAPNALVVTVRDNGIGFDESQREMIFEIFRRGTSKHPGSGLGLYLVRKHLAHLQGQIQVLSCRNDTIFEVRIPVENATWRGVEKQ